MKISVPAAQPLRPDWQTNLELATGHARCNLSSDVGGFPIAEGLAQGHGSRRAGHDSDATWAQGCS